MSCAQGHAGVSTEVAPGRWPSSRLAQDRILQQWCEKTRRQHKQQLPGKAALGMVSIRKGLFGDDILMSS